MAANHMGLKAVNELMGKCYIPVPFSKMGWHSPPSGRLARAMKTGTILAQ